MYKIDDEIDRTKKAVNNTFLKAALKGQHCYVFYCGDEDLYDIAVKGTIKIVEGDYISNEITDPTWLQLCFILNQQLLITNELDKNAFHSVLKSHIDENNIQCYNLICDS